MSDSWKLKRALDERALPGLLRQLAQALEGGAAPDLVAGLPAGDWRKLVLVAERGKDGLEISLKAKRAHEVLVPTRAGAARQAEPAPKAAGRKGPAPKDLARKDKYRQLKKGLQADFKALERAVDEGRLPGAEALESFLSRAEIMAAGSPGEDREMAKANAAFFEDAQALRGACQRRDIPALAEILGRLARRRSACHAQFK